MKPPRFQGKPRMIKRGSTLVDHFAKPTIPAVSAHQDGFEVRESCSDRVVVLAVSDAVDMLSAPRIVRGDLCRARQGAGRTHR